MRPLLDHEQREEGESYGAAPKSHGHTRSSNACLISLQKRVPCAM